MKTIVVATDFLPVSINAVHYAAAMTIDCKAKLVVVHVAQLPETTSDITLTNFSFKGSIHNAHLRLENLQNELIEQYQGLQVSIEVPIGSVSYRLQEIVKAHDAFCLVMGTESAGLVKRIFVGANTLETMHTVDLPVLVIPHQAKYKGIKQLILASDLIKQEKPSTLKYVTEWINFFKARFIIIYVANNSKMKHVAENIAMQNVLEDFKPEFHFTEKSNVDEGIKEYIEESHPDVLVVIHRRLGFLDSIFHKSKSRQFILHPHIPVLAISE